MRLYSVPGSLPSPFGRFFVALSALLLATWYCSSAANAAEQPSFEMGGAESLSFLDVGVQWADFSQFHAQEDRFFFNATSVDEGPALWVTDGTAAGTEVVVFHPAGPSSFWAEELTSIGSRLFFRRLEPSIPLVQGLWTSDGTPAGTFRLFLGESVGELGVFGDQLCFAATTSDSGDEPWCTDGSVEGTRLLREIHPGNDARGIPNSSYPQGWTQVGSRLFFEASSSGGLSELWVTDATTAGTRPLSELVGEKLDGISPSRLTRVGQKLFFFSRGPTDLPGTGSVVWVWAVDGESLDVTPIAPIALPGARPAIEEAVEFRGRLFFTVTDGEGFRLMRSDGTADGTSIVFEIRDFFPVAPGGLLTPVGNDLFFVLLEPEAGLELWATDGTPEGARRVVDSVPGTGPSSPEQLTPVDSRLLFTASDDLHGIEPWITDGTAEGTRRIVDLIPGPGGSAPGSFAVVGERIYFDAWAIGARKEVWFLDIADLGSRICEPREGRVCLGDGRYELLLDWRDPRTGNVGRATGEALTTDTGQFYFFRPENLEVITKTLDGSPVNGFGWVFYGSLTDLAFWLSAVDLQTGVSNTYVQQERETCGGADVRAFPMNVGSVAPISSGASSETQPPRYLAAPVTGACTPDATTLCLLDNRFQLELDWSDQRRPGRTGDGRAVEGTDQTGYFWFFQESNLELMVKVLDGRPVNGKYWVFYGSLTDVEFTMTVTDTVTGAETTYYNEPGNICGRTDTAAFEG